MINEIIKDRIYYKIFDKTYKDSSFIYNKHQFNSETKLTEIANNIRQITKEFSSLGAKDLIILNQIHSNKVILINQGNLREFTEPTLPLPAADAAVTKEKNIILTVQTADCVPVLLFDDKGLVVGAAHCGWQGAKNNIIGETVNLMRQQRATAIYTIIGPAIAQSSYEVSKDYYLNFCEDNPAYQRFFLPAKNNGKNNSGYLFDLTGLVKAKLAEANTRLAYHIPDDTYSLADKYPSYRRNCHSRKEDNKQRILSTIMIK